MRLPEIRRRIAEISAELAKLGITKISAELEELGSEIKRRPATRRTPPSSRPMTPHLACAIKRFAGEHPHLSHQEIAGRFKVNQGRVSEAISGKRR